MQQEAQCSPRGRPLPAAGRLRVCPRHVRVRSDTRPRCPALSSVCPLIAGRTALMGSHFPGALPLGVLQTRGEAARSRRWGPSQQRAPLI